MLSLAKEGAGTWTLSNANTYSGSTRTISNGTLASGPIRLDIEHHKHFPTRRHTQCGRDRRQLDLCPSPDPEWLRCRHRAMTTADGTVAPGWPGQDRHTDVCEPVVAGGFGARRFWRSTGLNTPSNADKIAVATPRARRHADGDQRRRSAAGGRFLHPVQRGVGERFVHGHQFAGAVFHQSVLGHVAVRGPGDHQGAGFQQVAAQPHITSIVLAGTTLTISGTNGTGGNQFAVLTSTNVGTPLSLWKPLVTNTFTGGNFSVPISR